MVKKIHHVGIVVENLARAYRFWRDALGLPLLREAEIADQGVRAALLAAGDGEIELLEPTDTQGGVAGRIAFLHPTACASVLVELATPPPAAEHPDSPVRFKRLVIGCRDPQETAKSYQQLFSLPEVAVNDGPRSMLGWTGGGTLLMVPASEVGGTLGMAALSMVAPEMTALVQRLSKIDAMMFFGASEITLKPEVGNNVHLHISRY